MTTHQTTDHLCWWCNRTGTLRTYRLRSGENFGAGAYGTNHADPGKPSVGMHDECAALAVAANGDLYRRATATEELYRVMDEGLERDPDSDVWNLVRDAFVYFPDAIDDPEAWDAPGVDVDEVTALVREAFEDQWQREAVTEMALAFSLCPVHFGDYASCFDDENPECEQVRLVHPNHDT